MDVFKINDDDDDEELRDQSLKKGICFPHRKSASWNFLAKIKNSLLSENIFHFISKKVKKKVKYKYLIPRKCQLF